MLNIDIEIRKLVAATPMGESALMELQGHDYERSKLTALRYSREKKYPIVILSSPLTQISFKRVTAEQAKTVTFPEMDLLAIGESVLFELPKPMHQRVRMAASGRNRRGEVMLSCTIDAGGIRVTRHPLTASEIAAHGFVQPTKKASKYGLERMETERQIRFDLPEFAEKVRLRQAVSTKARMEGWNLRCRLQDDGSMLVVRLSDKSQEGASV